MYVPPRMASPNLDSFRGAAGAGSNGRSPSCTFSSGSSPPLQSTKGSGQLLSSFWSLLLEEYVWRSGGRGIIPI